MSAAKERRSAKVVTLGEARAQRAAAAPTLTLETAGAMLRAARIDAGYTAAEVADGINVKAERLDAIEGMDIAALPAAPYTLGFVRAYAGYLGLPVEPLVARFREEAGWAKTVTAPKITAPKSLPRDREVGLVGILVVLGFLVWAMWQIVGRTPPEEEAALPSGFPIADRTEEVRVVPEVTTSLEDDLTLTPPVIVDEASPDSLSGAQASPAQQADAVPAETTHLALIPLVLTRPLGSSPETTPPGRAAPAEPRPSTAAALNERQLEEALRREAVVPAPQAERRAEPRAEPGRPSADRQGVGAEAAPSLRRAAPAVPTDLRPARQSARLTDPVSPVYPRRCQRRADEEEVVTVAFNVSRFGRVTGPSVAATTNSCFDDAALAAVSRFGFAPATEGGRAVGEAGRTSRIVFRKP